MPTEVGKILLKKTAVINTLTGMYQVKKEIKQKVNKNNLYENLDLVWS